MRQYLELRRLTPAGGIKARPLLQAAPVFEALAGDAAEPSRDLDLALLQASEARPDPLPLLCLRCRISHAIEAWLIATHRAHREQHGIELQAMASYGLDDDGALTIRTGPSTEEPFTYAQIASLPKGLISPFSAEVLRAYDPSLCGLPHWARLRIQAHNGLKAYFKQHGLLLISDWALLRHSSGRRVREAWGSQMRSNLSVESVVALHSRYQLRYDEALRRYKGRTGKASGWQPDQTFAEALDPERNPFDTIALLRRIAAAIRQYITGSTTLSLERMAVSGHELADPGTLQEADGDGAERLELRGLIDAALQRAMEQHMPQVLAAGGRKADLLRCLWAGWAEGLRQRALAERCGTSQGTVSKLLRPDQHATAMATAAAIELKRHEAFASCSSSVEAAERLVDALRNHLLEPEQEGTIAPLRQWVQTHLSQ